MQEPVRRAVAYIQKNYREPLKLADAAAAAGLSASYFSAVFHQTMGISFSKYLTEYRLQAAADNPERALMVATLMMTDEKLNQFVTYGYEGENYELVDGLRDTSNINMDAGKPASGHVL